MKNIFYTWGTAKPEKGVEHIDESKREQCKFMSIESLRSATYRALLKFLETVSRNPSLKERLLTRAQRYFANVDEKAD